MNNARVVDFFSNEFNTVVSIIQYEEGTVFTCADCETIDYEIALESDKKRIYNKETL